MTARRLLGLLTMFVTFHLALVGPDNACAEHGEDARSGKAGMASHHAMIDHTTGHDDSHAPCETPASAHCCDAVTSCSVTAAVQPSDTAVGLALRAAPTPASPATTLLSRALAPEPPPPKV